MSMTTLSIIIPNYNGQATISQCINSILENMERINMPYEIILVDDNSQDKTIEIVKQKFKNVRIIKNDKNMGASYTRNIGILESRGDLLLFVDNDVYLSKDCIKKLLNFAGDYDIVYPTVIYENGVVLSPSLEIEKKYIRRSPVFLIKKESVRRLDELFDEKYFIYYEDVDFFFRCFLVGLKCKYVYDAIAYHVIQSNRNLEKRFYLETRNKLYIALKYSAIPSEIKCFFKIPTLKDALSMFLIALSNKNIFADCQVQERISSSRLKLIYLFCKALLWNITNLKVIFKKREQISQLYRREASNE